ncbi:MAG: ABC transporter permease [Pirellulaceae bacterium]
MTTSPPVTTAVAPSNDKLLTSPTGWWARLDAWLDRASERLNPILVKEARQALKSRQFVVTFTLLLLCGLVWSLIGVAMLMPAIYYTTSGSFMLTGYYVILTVPMLLIVPYSAYRSLASEREDGTYDLLSITTLSSRQIVTGKLGSALLQMLVYYSALSPCIAFTYLLRGVDIVTILLVLFYTFWASVFLSSLSLLVATASRQRHMQVLLSVVLLIGLLIATITWWIWTGVFISASATAAFDSAEVWIVQGTVLSLGISYIVLMVLAAAARLSFASDNRSTRLRVVMLAQQGLFTGWMTYYWFRDPADGFLYVLLVFSAVHWMVMGVMMIGEWAQLSPRVLRTLPQSLLARSFLTWFNPGSGTGYVFAVANMAALTLFTLLLAAAGKAGQTPLANFSSLAMFGLLLWGYLATYLGIGRLISLWLRRYLYFGWLVPVVIHVALLGTGVGIPYFLQAWFYGFQNFRDYTALQAPNWLWTLVEAADGNTSATLPAAILVAVAALLSFGANLVAAAREVEQVRQEAPARVQLDERELHPERVAVEKRPASPFDEP